jgi:hypothetical protein
MQKIKSLFKRDYQGSRQVFDEVVPGSEWVQNGEGVATIKQDGTSCLIRNGKLYKRYDRKLNDQAMRRKKKGHTGPWELTDYKSAPEGWEAAEPEPDETTGHWPGWLPVGDTPDDQWHCEAFDSSLPDGTYELVGPKIQGNLYNLEKHELWKHGSEITDAPRNFAELKEWFQSHVIEGIVWHHPDGRMVKIKRKDFGLKWPE